MPKAGKSAKLAPNDSFKPNPLRSGKGMAETACHAFASTTRVGLTQVLGIMKEFTRQPSPRERIAAIVLSGALAAFAGSLAAILAFFGLWPAALIFVCLFTAAAFLLYRALLTAPRTLTSSQSRVAAWFLVVAGLGGIGLAALSGGATSNRLLVLGPSLTFLAAGVVGIKRRRHDA